jgi:hypothetical protein
MEVKGQFYAMVYIPPEKYSPLIPGGRSILAGFFYAVV